MTLMAVSPRMRKSKRKLLRCRYSQSSATFSEIASSSRPLTCAQPVSPGNNECTLCSVRAEIRSYWLNSAGRGPTKLMSPFKMHQSCGSSSKLVFRRKLPIGVRCRAASVRRCVATTGVSTLIVRNFGMQNRRLPRPTRCDQYSAGPWDVARTLIATMAIGRQKKVSARSAPAMSNVRFTSIVYWPRLDLETNAGNTAKRSESPALGAKMQHYPAIFASDLSSPRQVQKSSYHVA